MQDSMLCEGRRAGGQPANPSRGIFAQWARFRLPTPTKPSQTAMKAFAGFDGREKRAHPLDSQPPLNRTHTQTGLRNLRKGRSARLNEV